MHTHVYEAFMLYPRPKAFIVLFLGAAVILR